MFSRAVRSRLKLRLALAGPPKSGKSRTALAILTGLIAELREREQLEGNGRIAGIDTEHESLLCYADLFDFYCTQLDNHHPENLVSLIGQAERSGYSALLLDSFSHEWNGKGGCLEIHAKHKGRNSFAAWGEIGLLHNSVVEKILHSPLHIVCTIRSKFKHVQNGSEIIKLGYRPIQRRDTEFEFQATGYMNEVRKDGKIVHALHFDSTRTGGLLDGQTFYDPDESLGRTLATWCCQGEPREQRTAVAEGQLPASVQAELLELGRRAGMTEASWDKAFVKYGVARLADLSSDDARTIASNLRQIILKKEANTGQG